MSTSGCRRAFTAARAVARAAVRGTAVVAVIGARMTRLDAQPRTANVGPLTARPIADRVAGVRDGTVRFRYAVRPGVCGDGARSITVPSADGASRSGTFERADNGAWTTAPCDPGPAHVTLTVAGGVPRALRLAVGERWRDADDSARVVDIGTVPAAAAAAYLLDLAARADAPSPSRVLLGAVVADSVVVWPQLLDLARGERVARTTRRDATFWASRAACDATAARMGLATLTRADTVDRDVRRQVVFALSQHPGDERAATLTRVARTDRDPVVRCAALFWLGQDAHGGAADARTLDLFADVLRGR